MHSVLIEIPVLVWLQDYSRKIKKYKTSRSGTSFIFMNGINKYGHTIRMAGYHGVCIFQSPRSPVEGWENLSWLEAESKSCIGSQEVVGGAPRDHGLSGPRARVELQAVKGLAGRLTSRICQGTYNVYLRCSSISIIAAWLPQR